MGLATRDLASLVDQGKPRGDGERDPGMRAGLRYATADGVATLAAGGVAFSLRTAHRSTSPEVGPLGVGARASQQR
jgi:hypothetical protein